MFYLISVLWVCFWSVLSFFVYKKDKSNAIANKPRFDELQLDALALLGGWGGCYIAQRVYNHKTRLAYRRRFKAIVVVWIVGYAAVWAFLFAGHKI
ncbi:DUF1294 domain-containing protein [Xenorhabdus sp. TH1]|uniref:DUF1294 domain-containing protein n=1 Tax=Xenorhabdus sp. TH1 TaxID=3130166 RepID=UPI0030CE28D6